MTVDESINKKFLVIHEHNTGMASIANVIIVTCGSENAAKGFASIMEYGTEKNSELFHAFPLEELHHQWRYYQ